ncbi:MAG: hypothetical protein M3Y35_18775 [Actinomycetota bacterium]|nr:hypothetical protein [Actinomycetota bacterium]
MPDRGTAGIAAYEQSWTVAAARRFFADPGSGSRLNVVSDHQKADVRYREISFDIRPGVSGVATVVDAGRTAGPGVVLAHGGSDDGRRFLLTEAEQWLAKEPPLFFRPLASLACQRRSHRVGDQGCGTHRTSGRRCSAGLGRITSRQHLLPRS